jgi:prepilin-type N-terminal cleavage/methylation domain-containing protein
MLKKLNKKRNQKGFTLVELLIVIAIIGILAAIAIPQFSTYRAKAFIAATKSDAKNAYTALQAYISEYPSVTPPGVSATGPATLGEPYAASRVSKDVTIAIAGSAAGVATVTASHGGLTGSFIYNADGSFTDSLVIP